jgi:hypothetical protein
MTMIRTAAATLALVVASATACLADQRELAPDLTHAITKLLRTPSELILHADPSDLMHGRAGEDYLGERYHHSIQVLFTGKHRDSVETQIRTTAEVALRIGYLVLQEGYKPPGPDLIIDMALIDPDFWRINTFSVRYRWADVLNAAKTDATIAQLSGKGRIERISLKYWPTMCLNPPPPELFAGGDGSPEAPEDVENPKGKDLSCHRKR